jgi:hypothetical protein
MLLALSEDETKSKICGHKFAPVQITVKYSTAGASQAWMDESCERRSLLIVASERARVRG